MKKYLILLVLIFAPVFQTGCTTVPSARVVQVQTLKAVGHTAESAVALSAQMYRDGLITITQAMYINNLYDTKFQPAFRLAVTAVQANLDSIASPDLIKLAQELSSLVASYKK